MFDIDDNWFNKLPKDDIEEDSILIAKQVEGYNGNIYFNYKIFKLYDIFLLDYPHLFEGIYLNKPHKIFIDLDFTEYKDDNYIYMSMFKALYDVIKTLYNIEISIKDLLLFTSHGNNKWSYHVILNGYRLEGLNFNGKPEIIHIINLLKLQLDYDIDDKIYTSFRLFRNYNKCKYNDYRYKVLYKECNQEDIIINSLVTYVNNCKPLKFNNALLRYNNENVVNYKYIQYDKLLEHINKKNWKIRSYNNGILNLNRINRTYCHICNRNHDNENSYIICTNKIIKFYCFRNGEQYLTIGDIKDNRVLYRDYDSIISRSYIDQPLEYISNQEIKEDDIDIFEHDDIDIFEDDDNIFEDDMLQDINLYNGIIPKDLSRIDDGFSSFYKYYSSR